jgi:aspartate kinase
MVVLNDIVSSAYGDDKTIQARVYEELGPRFFDALATEIGKRVADIGDAVPVITGFFGMMSNSLLQSVGRGYSDLCAAMVAAALSAKELQIWKEVDGIFTADPRKVPSARLLNTITLEEAAELTYYGSEVIHPFTMDQIRCANIPLRIKNVRNPEGSGTIIFPSNETGSGESTPGSGSGSSTPSLEAAIMKANGYYGPSKHRRAPTALTTKSDILLVNVQSNRQTKCHGFLAQVFAQLNSLSVVVDLITSSETSVSLALGNVENRVCLVEGLEKCGKVEVLSDMAIVSVIGHRMRNMVGIAGQLFSKLASGGVNIYLIAQGASEINIS